MGSVWLPPPEPKGLKDDAQLLRQWKKDQRALDAQTDRIVGLLTVSWMCSLALPSRTHRSAAVLDARWHRYLFRRHVNNVLGWTTQREKGDPKGFSD
jgi:hypothetical protein